VTFTELVVTSATPGAEVGHAGAAGQVSLVTFLAEVTEQRSTEGGLVIAVVNIDVVLERKGHVFSLTRPNRLHNFYVFCFK
jgi:hypothetical protein